MDRRSLLQLMALSAASLYAPRSLAQASTITIYGPPVIPTMLLDIAAQQGKAQTILPWQSEIWRNVDILRAGLANKTIDLSIVPSYVAANIFNKGEKVKLLNIMTKGLLYIVGAGDSLHTMADLKNKRIVIPFKNDMPDLVLQILCAKETIDFASLNIQYTATPPEALALFVQGHVDYALLPEPMVSMAIMRGKQNGRSFSRVLDIQKHWEQQTGTSSGIPQAGLLVSDAFFNQHQSFLTQLQQDLTQAVAWAHANPKEAGDIGSKKLPVPSFALAQALPYSHLSISPAKSVAQDIQAFFTELHRLNPKIIGGQLPNNDLFAG